MFSRVRKIFTSRRELTYLAYHDSLTGLLNRNWLYKNINKIHSHYVYFIDINDLHSINRQGHTFGDNHIIKCVKSIKVIKQNRLIRYAGDEFILFTNRKNAVKTNKLFSVGVCKNTGCLKETINLADANMLKSKLNWKNEKII